MGRKDGLWHKFLMNNERYADMINAFGLDGAQIVTASDIMEADSKVGTKIRDEVRRVAFGVNFAMIGIESQELIDYSLVERIMYYDTSRYEKECVEIRRTNGQSNEELNGGERLYSFRKTDKLHPVVTFVVYCGKDPWDGARSIRDLIDTTDIPEELIKYISDYKINVIDVRRDTKKLTRLRTDVRDVLEVINCADDEARLDALLSDKERKIIFSEDAFCLAKEYANLKDTYIEPNEKGEYDMCKAWEDMKTDAKIEGKIEGKVLTYHEFGLPLEDIAARTEQTVDFVKDTLKANGVLK